MKFKTNIPALIIALLVFVATNGIVLSEHICNSNHTRDYSLFKATGCDMEIQVSSCCPKKVINKNKCCEHNQYFKKLHIEGYTASQLVIKPIGKFELYYNLISSTPFYYQYVHDRCITGIPPPDNLYILKYLLRPTPIVLQTFRC